jgi:hypothetical protein
LIKLPGFYEEEGGAPDALKDLVMNNSDVREYMSSVKGYCTIATTEARYP